jgi:hypothetical protein
MILSMFSAGYITERVDQPKPELAVTPKFLRKDTLLPFAPQLFAKKRLKGLA